MAKVTQAQIDEWKKKYTDVFMISVDGKACYLSKPDRKVLGYASAASKTNPLKFNEVILQHCWLGGDEEIKNDDDLFLSIGDKLGELIQIRESELKKL